MLERVKGLSGELVVWFALAGMLYGGFILIKTVIEALGALSFRPPPSPGGAT